MSGSSVNERIQNGYFVTGTDTGVGKTLITTALLRAFADRGQRTLGLKPVAAGWVEGTRINQDVLDIQQAASIALTPEAINPASLERAIAPHIAAQGTGRDLRSADLVGHCRQVCADNHPDFVVVEGAGGWLVPLSAEETMVDLCIGLGMPIILVVGLRLGCLNHGLLTVESVQAAGLVVAGWVANQIDPDMPACAENVATLAARISAPLLGHVPYLGESPAVEAVVRCLHPELLSGGVA